MNKWFIIPISFFILGLMLLVYGVINGEVTVGLVIFFPFIKSDGLFGFCGIMCLFLGMLSLFFIIPKLTWEQYHQQSYPGYESDQIESSSSKKTTLGGVVFLGPIPIVFGSNKKITRTMILISIIILVIILISVMLHFY